MILINLVSLYQKVAKKYKENVDFLVNEEKLMNSIINPFTDFVFFFLLNQVIKSIKDVKYKYFF